MTILHLDVIGKTTLKYMIAHKVFRFDNGDDYLSRCKAEYMQPN